MMKKHFGQSMMVMSILLGLLMVSAIGYSLMLSNQGNSDLTSESKRQAQSYLLAKSGLDVALATRLVPRSNQLNYITRFPGNGVPLAQVSTGSLDNGKNAKFGNNVYPQLSWFDNESRIYAFYQNAGYVTTDMTDPNSPVFGVFRYMVLGGDPARKATDGSYYNVNVAGDFNPALKGQPYSQLIENEYFRTDSTPFVVVSDGLTCVRAIGDKAEGTVQPGAIQLNAADPLARPTCPAGLVLDETIMVMPLTMEVMDPVSLNDVNNPQRVAMPDRTASVQLFKGTNQITVINGEALQGGFFRMPENFDSNAMRLFVPGYPALQASGANVNFQKMWAASSFTPPRLSAMVFFDSATRQVIGKPVVFCPSSLADCPAGFSNNSTRIVTGGNKNVLVNLDPVTNPAGGFPVTSTASIKLFYDGPIDYRSPYNYYINGTFNNPAGTPVNCSIDKQLCKIHMTDGTGNNLDLRDFNFLTLFPSNTQILISPTYQASALNRIIISGMRDYAGNLDDGLGQPRDVATPRTYDIKFRVN